MKFIIYLQKNVSNLMPNQDDFFMKKQTIINIGESTNNNNYAPLLLFYTLFFVSIFTFCAILDFFECVLSILRLI